MRTGLSQLGTWLLALAGFCCDHVCEEAGVDDPLHQAPPSLHELRLRREAILGLARHHGAREADRLQLNIGESRHNLGRRVYLGKLGQLCRGYERGMSIPPEIRARLTSLGFEHINFYGFYPFNRPDLAVDCGTSATRTPSTTSSKESGELASAGQAGALRWRTVGLSGPVCRLLVGWGPRGHFPSSS